VKILSIGMVEFKTVREFYSDITADLRQKGNYQWDRYYPNRFIIKNDLKQGNLYGMHDGKQLTGAIVLDTNQSKKYKALNWEDVKGTPLVIHRLAVHPEHQGKGYGKNLLKFAEDYAQRNGYTSIRFDVYSENQAAIKMYERAGYQARGMIQFPLRSVPYQCYEKILVNPN
jgi:ribosomal protein S18 acetylase RimI-like enzyme